MTTLPDPIVVLCGINPAGAPTSEPGQLPPSLPQETFSGSWWRDGSVLSIPINRGPRQDRQYVSPRPRPRA
jgi:hypothetical protein